MKKAIDQVLREIIKDHGIYYTALISKEGNLIQSYCQNKNFKQTINEKIFSAMISSSIMAIKTIELIFNSGKLDKIVSDLENSNKSSILKDSKLIILNLDDENFFCCFSDNYLKFEKNLNKLRMKLSIISSFFKS